MPDLRQATTMPLIPPALRGPITTLSSTVTVDHVLPSAAVELLVGGAPSALVGVAGSNSVRIHVLAGALPAGAVVTATWSLGGETSPSSTPQVVLGIPDRLDPPVVLSPVHTAADWIAVGGLFPGAEVTIVDGGREVGSGVSDGPTLEVRVSDRIDAGSEVQVTQSAQRPDGSVVESPPGQGLPAEERFSREEQPGAPSIVGPVHECAGAVLVVGAVPGCHVHLHTGGTTHEYAAVAESFWANLPGAAHAPATFTVTNELLRLGLSSAASPAVGVDPAAPLEAPRLHPDTQHCPSLVSVKAEMLAPGAALTFEMRGAGGTSVVGRAGAPDTGRSDTYVLGDLSALVPAAPPYPAVVLTEQLCTLAAESNRAWVHRPTGQQEVPPAFFDAPVECSSWLHVLNAWGSLVTVRSDQGDWPLLASWVLVPASGWVPLNRQLRAGEEVQVTVELGCVPEHLRVSDPVTVQGHGDPDALRIDEGLRPGRNRTVWVRHAVVGARLHVFVNGERRASVWVTGDVPSMSTVAVVVGELTEEDAVTARQTVCGQTFGESPAVHVTRGRMDLEAEPSTLKKGVRTAVTIRARDADLGHTLFGAVRSGGAVVGYLGQAFEVTAPSAAPGRFTVTIEGYADGAIDLPVAAPPPPPPATVTITSHASLGVAIQVIKEISWTLTGPGQSITQSATPNTGSAVVTLPVPPTGGTTVHYALSGKATIEFYQPAIAATLTKQVSVFYVIGPALQGAITVAWSGSSRTAEINISWAPIHDPQTGAVIDEVYVFVLNTMSG
ncbi:hypothetical protein [Georgenia muralis]